MKAPPKQPCCVLWCLIVKQNSDNERQVEQISRATTWGSSESQFAGFIAVGANRGGEKVLRSTTAYHFQDIIKRWTMLSPPRKEAVVLAISGGSLSILMMWQDGRRTVAFVVVQIRKTGLLIYIGIFELDEMIEDKSREKIKRCRTLSSNTPIYAVQCSDRVKGVNSERFNYYVISKCSPLTPSPPPSPP